MDSLQTEILQEISDDSTLSIEIIGINAIGRETENNIMTADVGLKWLQDDELYRVWDSWGPDYRDVYILNTNGLMMNQINLTQYDMGIERNRDILKEMLLEAATDNDTGL